MQLILILLQYKVYAMFSSHPKTDNNITSNTRPASAFLDQIKILRLLGSGYHAEVLLGQQQNGSLVAIKKYKQQTSSLQTLQHQLSLMESLDHQNLVRLISVRQYALLKHQNGTIQKCMVIIMEYVGGDLFNYISQTGQFSEKVTRTYFHQMINGLHYLHQKGLAHRDIKPENLLLSNEFILKLVDFGFATSLKGKSGTGVLKTKLGTEGYMAPEILKKQYEGKSVDIFAAGVILFIMYSGLPPFEKAVLEDPFFKLIKQKQYRLFWKSYQKKKPPGYYSRSFKDLFVRMVAYDPMERIPIEKIAEHPWVLQSICSHAQITAEFSDRQQRIEESMKSKWEEMQKQRCKRITAASIREQNLIWGK